MAGRPTTSLQASLEGLGAYEPERVVRAVDLVLADADRLGASDVHFEPTPNSLEVRFRVDGVLRPAAVLPAAWAPNAIARLKVLAELLTYRTDIPQEGGIRADRGLSAERRVSTFPTVHGEKAVVRLFSPEADLLDLARLGLPLEVHQALDALLRERSGAVFLTGPSGSGKTTTIYACLQALVRAGRHVVSIEDPVERIIEGVSQSQARPGTEFDFARGLRSLLRQDPDVIMVGEIRDRETAAVAVEAALTGHLVFSTLHAASACGGLGRLLDMGVEPYLLTGGVRAVLNQRLLRRLCECLGHGCDRCGGTGYRGRFPVAELLVPDAALRRAILGKSDTDALESIAAEAGLRTVRDAAEEAVAAKRTTPEEVERVLGPRPPVVRP